MKSPLSVLLVALIVATSSCKKDNITQGGTNTIPLISATINDDLVGRQTCYYTPKGVRYSGGVFSFNGNETFNPRTQAFGVETISLNFKAAGTGTYLLSTTNYGVTFWRNNTTPYNPPPPNEFYSTDSTHTGSVTLTQFDTVNHIASGSFSFIGSESQPIKGENMDTVRNGSFSQLTW
ncbi:MAG TPA: DUF6252 family protein [Bacteroidia bacterium]|nr:DUF6252 family protein [Bacteroidia bacterium]